jgi:hypothetical protein
VSWSALRFAREGILVRAEVGWRRKNCVPPPTLQLYNVFGFGKKSKLWGGAGAAGRGRWCSRTGIASLRGVSPPLYPVVPRTRVSENELCEAASASSLFPSNADFVWGC